MEIVHPLTAGVEHVGLAVLFRLGITEILESAGIKGVQRVLDIDNDNEVRCIVIRAASGKKGGYRGAYNARV